VLFRSEDVELMAEGQGRWCVKGRDIVLTPIGDMLDREISQESYCRQVLFR
jgi:hypothetical protein